MNKEAILTWQLAEGEPVYFLNSKRIGRGEEGFQDIIKAVTIMKDEKRLIISFSIKGGTGGRSLKTYLPFSKHYDELANLAKFKNITLELRPYNL